MATNTPQTLLSRATDTILVRENLEKKLTSGKKLRIYLGIDPSGNELHLGHAVVLRKLREFQELGHTVILLIGDYTGLVGDPTGKSQTRVMLTHEIIEQNSQNYVKQASKIIDVDKIELRKNSEWFKTLSFDQVLTLTSIKTVAQFLQREDFKKRHQDGRDIALVEFLYPLMQGYDAYQLRADVQIGGTDQLFNMLVGRDIQQHFGAPPLDVVTIPLLEGLDGHDKMSKSLNNYIRIEEDPTNMYGKLMSIPDELILRYYELLTSVSDTDRTAIEQSLADGDNPRDHKMHLARTIVSQLHSKIAAQEAETAFVNQFQKGALPEDIPDVRLELKTWDIITLLVETKLCETRSDARRMAQQGAVKIDQQKIPDEYAQVQIAAGMVIQVGKRKFCRVQDA